MRYAQILGFIDNDEIKCWLCAFSDNRCQDTEEPRVCNDARAGQHFTHALEDRPQERSLLFRQASFSSEPANVSIRFPGFVPSPQKIVPSPRKFTEDPLCDVR